MKTHRLPDELGGGLCRLVDAGHGEWTYARVEVGEGDGAFTIDLLRALLTALKPPLPEEPPIDAVIRKGVDVLERQANAPDGESCWSVVGGEGSYSWPMVCQDFRGDIVRLIPAPEPVALPWVGRTAYGSSVSVLPLVTGKVNDVVNNGDGKLLVVTLTPDLAREKARALWTAADKAEAEATS